MICRAAFRTFGAVLAWSCSVLDRAGGPEELARVLASPAGSRQRFRIRRRAQRERYAPGMASKTTSTIMIAVPRNIVMSVIADFAAYPDWAGVHSAEVLGEPGADGRARMVRFELVAGIIKDRVVLGYEWDGDEQVRWELAEQGSVISVMSGAYILADRGDGTEVTFELTVGVRIPVIGMLKRRAEKTIIDTALKGLKLRVEAAAGSS
jgi:Polyketide cyclase / dehydrase and lipid transport